MAKAPTHANNPVTDQVTIFDKNRNTIQASRLNAVELVRGGKYFWKAQDINVERPEADGPADPSAKNAVVFDVNGDAHEVVSANARDMINTGKYFWNNPKALEESLVTVEKTAAQETISEDVTTDKEPDTANDSETEKTTETPEPEPETLEAEALRVAGNDDVVAYLEGFSEEALRAISQERFGEKIHHRASKNNVIAKIVEFEEARLAGDDQAEA